MRKSLALLIVSTLLIFGLPAFAQGRELSFVLDAPIFREKEARAIAGQLNHLGIGVEVKIWTKAALREKIRSGEREAYLTDWGSAYFDPFDLALPKLKSNGRGNFSFYANSRVNELLSQSVSESSVRKRKELFHEVQALIYQDPPWVFGFNLSNIEASSINVLNFTPSDDNRINLHDVELINGNTLTVGMNAATFYTFDPAMHRSREAETVIRNMFDALVTRKKSGDIVPELAVSWEKQGDLNYLFHLRKGVTFHDGTPMTADDVVFTFERVLKPAGINGQSSPRKGLLGPLQSVSAAGNGRVRFTLNTPFPPFLQALVHFQVVPQAYIKRVGDAVFARAPVGTGPFRFTEGSPKSNVVLERFAEYYGGAPDIPPVGAAKLKRIVFLPIPNPSARVTALLQGHLNIIQAVPVDKISLLAEHPNIKVASILGTRSFQIELNNSKPPFDDIRIRKALNHAINWKEILDRVYAGYGQRLATCFLRSGFGHNGSLSPHGYNPGLAKQLIKKAGYHLTPERNIGQTHDKSSSDISHQKPEPSIIPASISAPEKVVIAISEGSAPFHFTDSGGKPSGMFVDLWRLWSESTGIRIEFKPSPWNESLKSIREGTADIHAGLFKSAKRDTYLDYGAPLHKSDTHFFHHKSILQIQDLEDLIPFKIGIIEGDFALDFIRKRLPEATLAIYPDNRSLFDAIEAGEIKVFVKDTPIARYHLSNRRLFHEYKFHSAQPLYSNTFFAAVKEGNSQLLSIVNKGLNALPKKKKAAIQRKWMGVSETKTEDVLTIALLENNMPFSGLNFEGKPNGLLVDIWSLWSERTGQAIEFKLGSWSQTRYMIEKNEADIHAGLIPTDDLATRMVFSQSFYKITANLFYNPKTTTDHSLTIPKREKIGIPGRPYYLDYFQREFPNAKPRPYSDQQTMVKAALSGEIQYFLLSAPVSLDLLSHLGASGQLAYNPRPLFTKDLHAAVRRSNRKLLKLVDSGLDLIPNSDLMEIEKRWLPLPELRQIKKHSPQIKLTLEEKQWLATHHRIRLGIDPDWPPFDYFGEDGQTYKGMSADYIQLLNNRLGLNIETVPASSWEEVINKAKRREIDVIASMIETEERKTFMRFTDAYLSFPWVIITREHFSFIGGIEDLIGKKVAVVKGYAIQERIQREYPDLPLATYATPLEGLMAVSTGKMDAYAGNLVVVGHLIQKHNITNLKVAAPTGFSQGFDELRLGVRKDWPILVSILNKGLAIITEEEKANIKQKWFSVRFEHGIDTDYIKAIAVRVAAVFITILGIILLWNRRLKREVNRRREAEEELKKLSLAVEQSPASVVITDRDGNIEYVNPKYSETTGYSFEDIQSTAPTLFQSATLSETTRKTLWSTIRAGNMWQGDLVNQKKNGERFWESVLIAPIFDDRKRITHYVAVREDITERKQTEKELLKARDAAETANRAKSVFLSNMSHEIRTPMNAILGFSQVMLRDSEMPDKQKENLRTIWRSGEHLLDLINDILEMSKIEAGRVALNLSSFNLHTLLDDLEMMFRVRTEAKAIRLSVKCSEQVPKFIKADQGKLRQILINLLGNAVKFTDEGGVVLRADAIQTESLLRFEIEDTGHGIPEEDIKAIFLQFQQAHKGRDAERGTGLGLAISQKYAQLMHGDITVASVVNKGSTFFLEIPFEQADPEEIEQQKPKNRVLHLKAGQDPVRVLVVDDQEVNRQLMLTTLTETGFIVAEAINGRDAIEKFNVFKPHLILMDIVMPEMGGVEATEKIMTLPGGNETIIFALTASVFDDEKDNILATGAKEFIRKPYREADLFQRMEKHMGLEFVFEDRQIVPKTENEVTKNGDSVSKEMINQLPTKLVKQLYQAVSNGYVKQINELIEQITLLDKDTADRLKQLALRFDYDSLLDLLK